MPTINRNIKRRPWEPERKKKQAFSRDTAFYHSAAWRKLSKAYRSTHPLCECDECAKKSVPLPSEHTDHIVPIAYGGDPLAWENLQALNRTCHNKKSAKERKR